MSADEAALSQFIEVAKHRGTVSIDELRKAFSIDSMEAQEIAAIVLRLEDAGISVDIDPALFSARHDISPSAPEMSRTRVPLTEASNSNVSRTSSESQVSKTAGPLSGDASGSDASRIPRSEASPIGKRLIWILILLAVIALFAIWWVSKA